MCNGTQPRMELKHYNGFPMTHNALKTYPLPEGEQQALLKTSLASEGLILVVGIVLAIALSAAEGGISHALPFGWLSDLASAMSLHWAMLVLPPAMIVLLEALDALGTRFSKSYRQSVMRTRQGVTGELPRMAMRHIVPCMIAAGICEELLFRYGLLGLAVLVLDKLLPYPAAAALAVALVSLAFWAAHVQYRDAWTSGYVIVMACLLGTVYLATGSLLSMMVAHALYNIADIAIERRKMVREPDYFHGSIPVDIVTRMTNPATATAAEEE